MIWQDMTHARKRCFGKLLEMDERMNERMNEFLKQINEGSKD